MGEGLYKAAKGLIRINVKVKEAKVSRITISGDFFMYPEDKLWELEDSLLGVRAEQNAILSRVKEFYAKSGVLTPGVAPEDFVKAIVMGIEDKSSLSIDR